MSAAAGRTGGARAQVMLRGFLVPFRPRLLTGPEVHLAASADAFDDNGHLVSALNTKALQALMDRLRMEIGR
jgi:chromate reductase